MFKSITLLIQVHKRTFSQLFKEKCTSEVVRIDGIIIFYLRKLWKAKFFILVMWYFWWGCRGNLKLTTLGSERVKLLHCRNIDIVTPVQWLYAIVLYTIQDTTCLMRTSAKLWRNTQTGEASISSWIAFGQKPSAVWWCGGRKGKHIASA